MGLIVITPPETIVSATEAKLWAPVFANDDDARVEALLAAAQATIEPPGSYLGRAFGRQVLEYRIDGWPTCVPTDRVRLPAPPLVGVFQVAYVDSDGNEIVLDASTYRQAGIGGQGFVMLQSGASWPTASDEPDAIRIMYDAGYELTDPQLLPAKQAVVMKASRLRSASTQDSNLRAETVDGIGSKTWGGYNASSAAVSTQTVDALLFGYLVPFV